MPSGQSESPTHIGVFRIFVHTVCERAVRVKVRPHYGSRLFFFLIRLPNLHTMCAWCV